MKAIYKHCIHDLFYTNIFSGLYFLVKYTNTRLETLKSSTTTLLGMEKTSFDDTRKFLSVIPENKISHLVQDIMYDRCQGRKGVTYLSHNRTEKLSVSNLTLRPSHNGY